MDTETGSDLTLSAGEINIFAMSTVIATKRSMLTVEQRGFIADANDVVQPYSTVDVPR